MPEFPDTETLRRKVGGAVAPPPRSGRELRILGRVAVVGFQVVAEVAGGLLLGWLVDKALGTAPRWTTVGGLVGVAVAIINFIRNALRLRREMT